MDQLFLDIRFALRSLKGSPLLTAAAVTSLALGIGASTAIFSAVDTFLFKPLEFEDSDRLVFVWSNNSERGWTTMSTSAPDFRDWRREASTLRLAAYSYNGANLSTDDGAIRLVQEEWFDEGFRQGSLISSAAVLFVLLIACANVANLLLARGADRSREIALRAAIGAGRGRIVRQLLTESLILAGAGGILGLGIGYLGMEGIRGLFPPFLPGVNRLALDGRALAFTGCITVLAGVLFGTAPALQTSVADLRASLVDGGRGGSGRRGGRMRKGLVMGEIGLSVVLLISAVLLVKAFTELRTLELGYDTEEAALNHLRPMFGNSGSTYAIPGEDPPEVGREPAVNVRSVSPAYFRVMGIERVAGRAFDDGDQAETAPVVVINERFADRHWEGRSPLGQRILIWDEEREIVGVVGDTREWGPDSNPSPMLYAPYTQRVTRSPFLLVGTERDIGQMAESVRGVVRGMDPDQAVYDFATLEHILTEEISGNLAMAKVLGTLALIAFLLSAVGVYGVISYSVAQRTREMGIRQSLGADRAAVRSLVIRQGLLLAGAGILAGLTVALATTKLLAFFLYGVSPFDPTAFASVPLVLLLTALAASWIPATRATRVDPVVALRAE